MMFSSTSDSIVAHVKMLGVHNRTMTIKQLLDDARKWKPHGYDTQVALRRDYYAGDQIRHLRNHLARRFPHTAHRMQPFVVNVFQHVVDQIAAIYRATPRREVFSAGSRDDVATQSMAALYSDAMVDTRMRRVEQIAAACGLAFVRVGWDEYDARLELTPFWPDCVGAVLHPDYPARIDRAYAIAARLSPADGLDSKDARYEIWTRGDDGWTCSVETSGGAVLRAPELHARLPWVAVPHAVPDGCLFELPPGDDVASQDALNAMYTDLLYTIEMQAYTQLTYTGAEPPGPIVAGPGTCLLAGEGGAFSTISYTPQIDAVKNAADEIVGRLLVLRGVSPSSARTDPTYQSGVALKVENAPMLEARQSRVPVYRDVEQRHLWPVCRDVVNAHVPGSFDDGAAMRWMPGELMLPLDDEAELRLSQGRVANNVSTWPHEMVRLRLAENLDQARGAYEDAIEFNAAHPMDAGIPFIKSADVAPRIDPDGQVDDEDGSER